MNRWVVYNWLKHTYMYSGRVPTLEHVRSHFRGADETEIREGCIEFTLVTKRLVQSVKGA